MIQNKEEEEIVLSSLFMKKDSIYEVNLEPKDFYDFKRRKIFQAMVNLRDHRRPVDIVSVGAELGKDLKGIGGHTYLSYLVNRVPVVSNMMNHAKEVKRLSYNRSLIDKSYKLIEAVEKDKDISEKKRDLIDIELTNFKPQNVRELVDNFSEEYMKPIEKGIMTGIEKLDEITSGIRAGELFTVTATPGLGKSNISLNFASYALKGNKKVLFVNLEMDSNDILSRLLAIHNGLDAWKIRNKSEDTTKVMNALGELDKTNFKLLTAYSITVEEIVRHALIEKKKNGLDLLIVDYLNRIKGDKEEKVRIDNSVKTLKACAMELKIPVIVPYQVDKIARRDDRVPRLEDARGSTVVGDEAGLAIALTNESMKEDNYKWNDYPEDRMRLFILKNRHGASGGFIDCMLNKHSLKII